MVGKKSHNLSLDSALGSGHSVQDNEPVAVSKHEGQPAAVKEGCEMMRSLFSTVGKQWKNSICVSSSTELCS